jgi:hypothetical protein
VTSNRCQIARENVHAAVNRERRFPRNVFGSDWSEFFFFDSDWMTDPDFVELVKTFLKIERADCVCLWKLDAEDANAPEFFLVQAQTIPDEYRVLLAGATPGYGWVSAMERLGCASDVGEWCMYCEPNNEIAVIAFRQTEAAARYASAMARVHATRFEEAIREPPLSYGFSERALSREWRDEFLREYAARAL